jgi:arsenate reductase
MTETTSMNTKKFFEESLGKHLLSENRKELLHAISKKITATYIEEQKVNLNFICTHNSRRSQLAQVWSFFATDYFKLDNILLFSGGTEATAFYKNTVKTLQEVGFIFHLTDFNHQNPKYAISFKGSEKELLGFSKTFDDTHNQQPYIAITTCDNADENCPFIPNATHRFHLPFTDPKVSDDTQEEGEFYLKINQQIAGEVFVIFSEVKKQITEYKKD